MTRTSVGILILAALGACPARADDRPNVIVAIADDWSFPYAGAYGDKVVKTPAFDRVAREGVLFTNAYCASPSCTPSRGAILTGQAAHRLENGGNLWSLLPKKFATYPDLLEAAGYKVAFTGKGWGPGTLADSGRKRNPAGPNVKDFTTFLKSVPKGEPFCYWFGSVDPHRPYEPGTGRASGLNPADVTVPAFWPDTAEVRNDILDYYFEVQRFDRDLGTLLQQLDAAGLAENTIVIVTSDNGMPFPRCKANLYDQGTHMPLAIRWPKRVPHGLTIPSFVGLADLAPTILHAAGLEPPAATNGRDLIELTKGGPTPPPARSEIFFERERHANVRAGNLSYPCRAVRTQQHLYIRNLRPDRWPAGDPVLVHSVGPFGDVDPSPTKDLILDRRDDPLVRDAFRLAFAKRPAEELYDLQRDPYELTDLADDPAHASIKTDLRARLDRWMTSTADPLASDPDPSARELFDDYPYVGPPEKK
jgi:N-sulfoglucosamine sulfohydrolase